MGRAEDLRGLELRYGKDNPYSLGRNAVEDILYMTHYYGQQGIRTLRREIDEDINKERLLSAQTALAERLEAAADKLSQLSKGNKGE